MRREPVPALPPALQFDPDQIFVVLARIGRPHGVHGWLNVDLAGSHLRELVGNPIHLVMGELAPVLYHPSVKKSLHLTGAQPERGTVKHIALEGIVDRTSAAQVTNLLVALPLKALRAKAKAQHASSVAPLHELWYFEIYGLCVRDYESHELVGYIIAVEDFGRNTVVSIALDNYAAQVATLEIPLDYPHWGMADLEKGEILLAEWRQFLRD